MFIVISRFIDSQDGFKEYKIGDQYTGERPKELKALGFLEEDKSHEELRHSRKTASKKPKTDD